MSATHNTQHEALLVEFLCGERLPDDAEVGALLRDCEECRRALEELRSAQEVLQQAAADRLESVRDLIEAAPSEADRRRVERAMPAQLGRPLHSPDRTRGWLVAAAAVLLLVWGASVFWAPTGDRPDPVYLGSTQPLELRPSSADPEWTGTMEWTGTLGEGCVYQVRVFRETAAGRELVDESRNLTEHSWSPQTGSWPARVLWEVRVLGPTGESLLSSEAAWERP